MRNSILPSGLYHLAIDAWAREFPSIALQTFQNLQDAIQVADNNRDRLATAMSHGYGVAAAVRAVPTPAPITDSSLLLAQFAAMAARIEAWEAKTALPPQPKNKISIVTLMGSVLTQAKTAAPPDQITMRRQQQETPPWVVQMRHAA